MQKFAIRAPSQNFAGLSLQLNELRLKARSDNQNKSSAVAERWATYRHGPKRGGCCAPFALELGARLTQCGSGLGRGLIPYQVASLSIQPFGHNKHGPKNGGCAPFRGEGSYDAI